MLVVHVPLETWRDACKPRAVRLPVGTWGYPFDDRGTQGSETSRRGLAYINADHVGRRRKVARDVSVHAIRAACNDTKRLDLQSTQCGI